MGDIPDYTPPPAELQKRMAPRVEPGLVGGMLGGARANPDRLFLVLEKRKDGPDRVWEVDGYVLRTGGHEHWRIHLLCPVCEKGLTLDNKKKSLRVSDKGLEVENFRCSWDGDFGQLRCTFQVSIRLPKEKDEAIVRCDNDPMNPRKIDGVFVT